MAERLTPHGSVTGYVNYKCRCDLCREGMRSYVDSKTYGVSRDYRERTLKSQSGSCGICGGRIDLSSSRIDHCHTTNRVRGLLCVTCNNGLGKLKDDPDIIRAALRYLKG